MGYTDLVAFRVILGFIQTECTCLRMACNSKTTDRRLKRSDTFGLRDTNNTYMGQYSLHLLHSLSNQGYSAFKVKIMISHFRYIAIVAKWLLGINLTCSNLHGK